MTFDSPAQEITPSRDLAKGPRNGGLECVTVLPSGKIFTLAEELQNKDGSFKGWLIDDQQAVELSYLPGADFRVSDCDALPNGDVIVLERHLSIFLAFSARLKLIRAASIRRHALFSGEDLLQLEPPLRLDNFEGIAVREDAAGTLIYLIRTITFSRSSAHCCCNFACLAPITSPDYSCSRKKGRHCVDQSASLEG